MEFTITRTSGGYYSGKLPIQSADPKVVIDEYTGKRIIKFVVQVDTLEDLIAIIEKEGNLVLAKNLSGYIPYSIEICDDYRE